MTETTVSSTPSGIDWDHIPMLQAIELMKTADPEEVRLVRARWSEHFRQIAIQTETSIRTMVPDAYAMGQLGWTVPTWGPMWLARYVSPVATEETLDAFFLDSYRRRWNARQRRLFWELRRFNQLAPWQALLKECIEAYKRRRYHIVIPALLTILEGVVAGATANNSIRLQQLVRAQANASDAALIEVTWHSILGFLVSTFANVPFDATPPNRLNRHWVLHGRQVSPPSRIDCLRLFQAIHTTAYLWEWSTKKPSIRRQ